MRGIKNREMEDVTALGGCHFGKRFNNQPNNSVDSG